MRNKFRFLMLMMALAAITGVLSAQEKYAVLIIGDYAGVGIPPEEQWNNGEGKGPDDSYYEFWNDTFLMWEMLTKEDGGKGYSDENVFVLFADGLDFQPFWMDERYRPEVGVQVTDYSATIANVQAVFNGLRTGLNGFPLVTENDFLFVWTFDHGNGSGGNSSLLLMDGSMSDDAFAALVNPIPAHKKVLWMQQCRGGGFEDELHANNTVFVSASQADENALRADDIWDTENEVISNIQYPHGEFDFHIYSSTNGENPAGGDSYGGEPFTDADLNSDGFVSVLESYTWEDNHESIQTEDPLYSDPGSIGSLTTLDYPTLLHGDIGDVGLSVEHRGLIGISKDVHIVSGSQVIIKLDADVFMLNESKLYVDQGASLIIEGDAVFTATNNNNKIVVDGSIEIGRYVTFTSLEDVYWEGISINNESLNVNLVLVDINNCSPLTGNPELLTVDECNFNYSGLIIEESNAIITNCQFINSYANFSNARSKSGFVEILNSDFINNDMSLFNGVVIDSYPNYKMYSCIVKNYLGNGIVINYSGFGGVGEHSIKDNFIQLNSIISPNFGGITIYGSRTDINGMNTIIENKTGVLCLNNSEVSIEGIKGAVYIPETQRIYKNSLYQVFATYGSFPFLFRFNAVYTDPVPWPVTLVKYQTNNESVPVDVRYNYWGIDYVPTEIFDPYELFIYLPDIILYDPTVIEGDELLFSASQSLANSGNFTQAEANYKELVETYPNSKFSTAALSELFSIEEYVGNDYVSLKNYYNSLISQTSNDELAKAANSLSNKCNISLGNFGEAIEWYENVIQDPPSFSDSLFAIIDLGKLYLMMENTGFKNALSADMPEYRPVSIKQHAEYRDYLLSLLFKDEIVNENSELIPNENNIATLLPNIPNPFKEKTMLWYAVNKDSHICINIIDQSGRLIKKIDEGWKVTGQYQVELITENLAQGLYFCTVECNGIQSDTRKITLIK